MKCPNCQFENRDNAKFCKSCGHKLTGVNPQPAAAAEPAAASAVCPVCGAALKPGAKFCTNCGNPFKAAAMPETVAATPETREDVSIEAIPDAVQEPEVVIPVPETSVDIQPETASAPVEEIKAETLSSPAFCKNCGAPLKPGAKFCTKCGTAVPVIKPESVSKPEPVPVTEPILVPEPIPAPEPVPVTEPIPAPEPVPVTEPIPAPEPVPITEPIPAPEPVPVTEPVPVPESIPVPEPIPAPEPVPVTEPVPVPEPVPVTEPIPAPEPVPIPEPIPVPKPVPAPEPVSASFCKKCGAPLKPGARFCTKCGAATSGTATGGTTANNTATGGTTTNSIVTGGTITGNTFTSDTAANNNIAGGTSANSTVTGDTSQGGSKEPPRKKTAVIIIVILVVLLLLGGGLFALIKTGIITLPSGNGSVSTPAEEDAEQNEDAETAETEETDADDGTEDISAELEEKLAPIAEQVAAAEEMQNSEDHNGAAAELSSALTAYASMASEYDSQNAADTISPLADHAFSLYTTSILKQVESWESQSVTAPLYQQIDITLKEAVDLGAQLRDANLTVTTDELDQNYAEFPDGYKEKYILTFNDLRTGDEWSRTTAWQYMQDAASVGLVDRENINDPLTLRYAYALAWITQRDLSEGMKDGSVTTESAISSILSLAESIDYNPVLMRDLALYYDALGDSGRSKIMQTACTDVYNYLANTENVYLNGEELFVPGRNSSNASSTISLNDFWYFNDFGEYAPSGSNNGVSPEGREYIRNIYKEAINAL